MSKRIHLVCNAHIDPVWQWEWEEGAAETISTFRVAADFCEEYDGLVFCHNEALLYRWVEEYEPALFRRIEKLVAQGKWHIMGGWHLQPDCNMPSGEGFVRQIFSGRRYFKEKLNAVPKVAVNCDPFGHSRGLVQIMAKSGYEGYLFMRPSPEHMHLPEDDFRWIGYDGSSIIGTRMPLSYGSNKGEALDKVLWTERHCPEDDFMICLWGVGNHGGGPSRIDLEAITAHMAEVDGDIEVIHSTPEAYLEEVKARRLLKEVRYSLNPWAAGCYTSMVTVKQKYRQAESMYFVTERMCAHAASLGLMKYPQEELDRAEYDLLTVQFHDILPGSSIQSAEELAVRFLDHSMEYLSRVKARAFFALCTGQIKAEEDAIPILVYNPMPYPVEGDFTCELMLWDQVRDLVFINPTVYANGQALPTQAEKENSSIPIEWRKRIIFHATLEPMCVNRFDCKFETLPCRPERSIPENDTHLIFQSDTEEVWISKATGLIDKYLKNGKEILASGAFRLDVFQDDHDPWGMTVRGWEKKLGVFCLMSAEECGNFCCVKEPIAPVRLIEDGPVRKVVEAVFAYKNSRAVVNYILSRSGGMQLKIRVFWNEKQELLKLRVPAAFPVEECVSQQPYGQENPRPGAGEENVGHGYTVLKGKDTAFSLCNKGTYGYSYDDANDALLPTLLRSPSYCAHPIDDRDVLPQDRFTPYIDQGERIFVFDFSAGAPEKVAIEASRRAQLLNEEPMALSFYPSGQGTMPATGPKLESSDAVQLTAFKAAQVGEGYILRLFNSTDSEQSCRLSFLDAETDLILAPYEIRTLRFCNGSFEESDLMEGLLK